MNNKIYISVPGYVQFSDILQYFILYKTEFPQYFYSDVILQSVYDCFPCIWNGGRVVACNSNIINAKSVDGILNYFNENKIEIRHTFTNALLEEKHLSDTWCNKILELTNKTKSKNSCIVNSKLLFDYIKENYPNIRLIWSTTLGITDIEKINELSNTNMFVLNYSLNRNWKLLDLIKHPENIEILACEYCIENCPLRMKHYNNINQLNLNENVDLFLCPHQLDYYYTKGPTSRNYYLDTEIIRKEYLPKGFTHFKISGRDVNPINFIESLINYFIKPEYKDLVRNEWLIDMFNQHLI